ncbi:MAG: glycosyltransferase family 1 protein [Sphingobacteriaceae bacterium]|nr:MAG: glycosyltransferase family 1 protein [Sphingobacteriaceae bacterium]
MDRFTFHNIPLLIDNKQWVNQYSGRENDVLRIGMFSRIHSDQPTVFSFYVIHELKRRLIPVEFYFFGRYYDASFYEYYTKIVHLLKITSEVKFMGHVIDIANAIQDSKLNVGLMNAIDYFVGYSSIEIQSHGLPVVFFNVTESGYYNNDFPIVLNYVNDVCDKIENLWKSNEIKSFSDKTFLYSKQIFGVENNMKNVLKVYSI